MAALPFPVPTTSLPESWLRAASGAYERHGRLLPGVAAALLALLLGRVVADLAWVLVPLPDAARWQPPPVAPPTGARTGDPVDVNAIVNAGLFGRYQAPAAGETLLTAPETVLNLTLIGLHADDREE